MSEFWENMKWNAHYLKWYLVAMLVDLWVRILRVWCKGLQKIKRAVNALKR